MSRKLFTEEQQQLLRNNPYVYSVTPSRLQLTKENSPDQPLTEKEEIQQLRHEIDYLKQEMEFLKKISSIRNTRK